MKKMKPPERSNITAQFLMRETFPLRQKWIQEDLPVVKEILNEFPLLESYINVSATLHMYNSIEMYYIKVMAAYFGI